MLSYQHRAVGEAAAEQAPAKSGASASGGRISGRSHPERLGPEPQNPAESWPRSAGSARNPAHICVRNLPLQRGFLYLVAVMDWASRTVLSWRLSNTLDAHFCVEALHEALEHYGPPEIFNSDQGSQFTSVDFTDVLQEAGIRISMDGKGRWMDNVFIERLWRSLKYECVYLSEFATGSQARTGIGWWMDFYDRRRPHSALNDRTPAEAYTDDGADGSPGLCPGSRQPKVA